MLPFIYNNAKLCPFEKVFFMRVQNNDNGCALFLLEPFANKISNSKLR